MITIKTNKGLLLYEGYQLFNGLAYYKKFQNDGHTLSVSFADDKVEKRWDAILDNL